MQACTYCRGQKAIPGPAGAQKCPVCDGAGTEFDPGRHMVYELGPIVVQANATVIGQTVQVLDGNFRWQELTGTQTSGAYTLKIYRGRDSRPFMQQQVHHDNIVGTAVNPFPLLTPFTFINREYIMVDITDLSGAPNTIRLAFIGSQLEQNKGA